MQSFGKSCTTLNMASFDQKIKLRKLISFFFKLNCFFGYVYYKSVIISISNFHWKSTYLTRKSCWSFFVRPNDQAQSNAVSVGSILNCHRNPIHIVELGQLGYSIYLGSYIRTLGIEWHIGPSRLSMRTLSKYVS